MSKLDELIRELCPDGVEYKKLGEIATKITDGMHNLPKGAGTDGAYPILSAQNINNGIIDINASKWVSREIFEIENRRTNVQKGDVLLTIVGAIGRVAVVDTDLKALFQRSVCVIKLDNSVAISRYVFFALQSSSVQSYIQVNAHGAAQKGIYLDNVSKIVVPLPPIEVQSEIVRMLDGYTESVVELQKQLTAELTARKTQYSYYRDKMLTFGDDDKFRWENLGDMCDILTGYPFDSSQFQASGVRLMRGMNIKRGNLFFSEEINRYWNSADGFEKYLLKENDIVIAMDGSLVGKSFGVVQAEYLPLLLVQRVARIRSEQVNNRYIYHYIACRFPSYVEKKKTGGAIPHVSQKDIASFRVPVPSAGVQNRIVNVLDNFEKICSDLNIGLPAEIEARQKQYEYYRDKLLTFAETGNTILSRAEQSRAEQSRAEQSRAER